MNSPDPELAKYAAKIAFYALCVSSGSLAVAACVLMLQVRRWLEDGVRLSISLMVDGKMFGGIQQDDNTYLVVNVTNRGGSATTITHYALYHFPNRISVWLPPRLVRKIKKFHPKTFIVNTAGSQPLPYLLEPGRTWMGMAKHDKDLPQMIETGRLFVAIIGSHRDKAFFRRVRRWKAPKNADES